VDQAGVPDHAFIFHLPGMISPLSDVDDGQLSPFWYDNGTDAPFALL
jgi:hypothetical protein